MANKRPPVPQWLQDVNDFADALGERAEQRSSSSSFFRQECKDDVEYMQKAARLLKMMAIAYFDLSCQINNLYDHEVRIGALASDAIETVKKQAKKLEV